MNLETIGLLIETPIIFLLIIVLAAKMQKVKLQENEREHLDNILENYKKTIFEKDKLINNLQVKIDHLSIIIQKREKTILTQNSTNGSLTKKVNDLQSRLTSLDKVIAGNSYPQTIQLKTAYSRKYKKGTLLELYVKDGNPYYGVKGENTTVEDSLNPIKIMRNAKYIVIN